MQQFHGTWGRRVVTRQTPYEIVTILYLDPYKRCSWHSHKMQFNQFYVISGELVIKTDVGPGNQRSYTTLYEGQTFTVQPGLKHEFQTRSIPTVVEEIAYVEYDKGDIHRELLGGDIGNSNDKA